MKRIVIISLIIAAVSSIIFFIIALNQNNEIVAAKKTLIAFPALSVVCVAVMLIIDFIKPSGYGKKDKTLLKNIDYDFKDIGERKQ